MDFEKYGPVFRSGSITIINCDCMDLMKDAPDNYWQLACVDPPYGIGMDGCEWNNTPTGQKSIKGKSVGLRVQSKGWDSEIPKKVYFDELARVSSNQIIWGGNYFTNNLPPSRCWLCWDKKQPDGIRFSQFELAWTSLDSICKVFRMYPTHVAQGTKIHPTQKPMRLYEWLLTNYAEKGHRILDTHGGSMSIALACHNLGFDLTLCEIDKDYFDSGIARYEQHIKQLRLF